MTTCFSSSSSPPYRHLLLPPSIPKTLVLFSSPYLNKPSFRFLFNGTSPARVRSPNLVLCSTNSSNINNNGSSNSNFSGPPFSGDIGSGNFCIIEGPETIQDFMQLQLQDIQDHIRSRRNRIFLLMEEVRRLRVQQRLKSSKVYEEAANDEAAEMADIPSSIPFLTYVTPKTLRQLYMTGLSLILGTIFFGGLIAPKLELKLGLGGTSYEDFILSLHLPLQLSQVDPIVASFSGGAVGVISTLMLIEANNVKQQEKKRCKYCHGTGYLPCARCSASGVYLTVDPISLSSASNRPLQVPTTKRCLNCSGAGKVMCPTCLCTGMVTASEYDPRFDPFD